MPQLIMRVTTTWPLPCILAIACLCCWSCQKQLSTEAAATGTLLDGSGNCMAASVAGTYYVGVTPGADTAYVLVTVNVKTAGSYTITSDVQNGLYFSGSGNFSSAGLTIVKLKPSGTPLSIGSNIYSFSFDTSACYFSLTVNDSAGKGIAPGLGAWQFVIASAGETTRGSNAAGTLISSSSISQLYILGKGAAGDTSLSLIITLPSAKIPASGQYTAAGGNVTLEVTDAYGNFIYSAIALPGVTLSVNITSYNTSTKELKGTFSGVVDDAGGRGVALAGGIFDVIVQ